MNVYYIYAIINNEFQKVAIEGNYLDAILTANSESERLGVDTVVIYRKDVIYSVTV